MTISGCSTTPIAIQPRIPVSALMVCDPLLKAGDLVKPVRLSDIAILNVRNTEIHENCMSKQEAFANAVGVELIRKEDK